MVAFISINYNWNFHRKTIMQTTFNEKFNFTISILCSNVLSDYNIVFP